MNLVWKLLRQHVNITQLTGFFLANLTGMLIVLLAVQAYTDLKPLFSGGDTFLKKDYLIVTKRVGTLGMLTGKNTTFTAGEIEEIQQQPFVKKVGGFTPSRFSVTASVEVGGQGFATEMFFEAVPDDYVDVNTTAWTFEENKSEIPIIIPRNYLNLYNFGFAQSRNLPKISEKVIGMLRMDIELRGNGIRKEFKGRIVGFSDRLNTILVPEKFMDWGNRVLAPDKNSGFSRLILETGNPADQQMVRYFKQKGYETEDGKLDAGKTMWFLNVLVSAVIVIGLLICLLSLYILMLSVYLILQKNSTKLENLLLIGYSVRQVALPYQRLTVFLNVAVVGVALTIVGFMRHFYLQWLNDIWPEFSAHGVWPLCIAGLVLFAVVSLVNSLAIWHKISKL